MTATVPVPIRKVKWWATDNALTLVWLNVVEIVLLLIPVLR